MKLTHNFKLVALSVTIILTNIIPFFWEKPCYSQTINTIAGTGTAGYNGDGIAATAAQVNYLCGVASDPAGNVYIADWMNNRVRKITASTGIISTRQSVTKRGNISLIK